MELENIINYVIMAVILLFSIGLHEYAHARSADKLGDPTPRLQWRLTMNPLKHISLIGFFAIFFIGFWRGKPVQINPTYFKKTFRDELITSLAGPVMNLLLALIGGFFYFGYGALAGIDINFLYDYEAIDLVTLFFGNFITLNVTLAVFNLLPIYPLDGYRLIGLISKDIFYWIRKNATVLTFLFLIFMLTPAHIVIIRPLAYIIAKISGVISMIFSLIFF